MAKRALGRGLSALLSDSQTSLEADSAAVIDLPLDRVRENPLQPRRHFDEARLQELARSIEEHGVVQPVVVTREAEGYRLVVGERRCRAARLAGRKTIPALVREFAGAAVLEVALIENLQRQDLNPIEEAQAFSYLIREMSLTQEALSQRLGCSRPAVANALRLLSLPPAIRQDLESGLLSAGHARAVLTLASERAQLRAWKVFQDQHLSVRQAEEWVRRAQSERSRPGERPQLSSDWLQIQGHLTRHLGTSVSIRARANGRGRIELAYRDAQELERLVELLIVGGDHLAWQAGA